MGKVDFDLLTTVESSGGCSAKLPPAKLDGLLDEFSFDKDERLLVGAETHDDASVWKINDEVAIIQTTDFFPPLCSDAYEFGQIAAANSISDVYAMGGTPITALNLVMFPSKSVDMEVLKEMLRGGADKMKEAGVILTGGHTIEDKVPKYGLAVTGTIHPQQVISNAEAKVGDQLILTKAIGTGTINHGYKEKKAKVEHYQAALDNMKLLNKTAAEVMQQYKIKSATDITGFGVAGHLHKMATASGVSMRIDSKNLPLLDGAYELTAIECTPCPSRRNREYVNEHVIVEENIDKNLEMLIYDAQTSGGIMMAVPKEIVQEVLNKLHSVGLERSAIIGEVISRKSNNGKTLRLT